jgi:hypothetical protein
MTTSGTCRDPRERDEELEEMGVESIHDIPDDFELTEIQRRAATCVQTGEPWFSPNLARCWSGLKYPLYFADFESVNPAVPRFPGMRPYDHLPFQWSVHVQRSRARARSTTSFLPQMPAIPGASSSRHFALRWARSGSIVVYSSFESQRLSDLASWFPEHADRINAIQARLFDLLPVVREHTYHPAYAGSYSIKSVLPALVPEMTYEGMEVANGQDAGLAWESLVRGAWMRRARQDQEGSAGLLRAGHAGTVKTPRSSQAKQSVILRYRTIPFWLA